MRPMLAHVYEPHRVTFPLYVQPKLNGIRALYQNGVFQSRDQLPFPKGLLDHLALPLKSIFPPEVILDGELYKHGWPLGRINGAVTPIRNQPTEDTLQVEYHVFDVVDFEKGFPTRFFQQQHEWLHEDIISSPINFVETAIVGLTEDADEAYADYVSRGYEGMMYRLGQCPYTTPKQSNDGTHGVMQLVQQRRLTKFLSDQDNRTWHLLKRKDWQDDEFDFISINETTGELGQPGFQLWCKAKNGRRFKMGSGLTQAQVVHYIAHPPVGRQIKGKYLVLSADGIPLNATVHPDHIL